LPQRRLIVDRVLDFATRISPNDARRGTVGFREMFHPLHVERKSEHVAIRLGERVPFACCQNVACDIHPMSLQNTPPKFQERMGDQNVGILLLPISQETCNTRRMNHVKLTAVAANLVTGKLLNVLEHISTGYAPFNFLPELIEVRRGKNPWAGSVHLVGKADRCGETGDGEELSCELNQVVFLVFPVWPLQS
jgi:hypothetical protein